ncbi:uncharacterized protein B0I36DRAFT_354902 [Microdochium trichocladiopsis]|uniref:NAD(+) ADP-ribosyltransferase n=1 Tax=Microdochium trichocladiopsis TaxID=1682393 RepID=A0A9P8XT00_9PEZI|nr:uncharacterized protein B0I36DRAFT_354902 [Microdochium trichocladiopsis]KAH7016024.1 hypothetical protein B0I36DRAFT_354902 [Microdochium trichocladiopsis]
MVCSMMQSASSPYCAQHVYRPSRLLRISTDAAINSGVKPAQDLSERSKLWAEINQCDWETASATRLSHDKAMRKPYIKWQKHLRSPIGQSGQLIKTAESPDLRVLSRKFSYHFKGYTSNTWARRYTVSPDEPRVRQYEFVELDYGQTLHLPDLPDYTALHSTAPGGIEVLLDLALYGKGHKIFTPVISSYKALYLELRVLHSLSPYQQEISRTEHVVKECAMMDWRFHGAFALPWYHAYSSLSHGFRRLEDPTSTEYRELCQYLFGSNQPTHKMSFEIKDIYEVFVKTRARNAYENWIQSREDRDTEERLLLWHGTRLSSLHGILDVVCRSDGLASGTLAPCLVMLIHRASQQGTVEPEVALEMVMRFCFYARPTSEKLAYRVNLPIISLTLISRPRVANTGAFQGLVNFSQAPAAKAGVVQMPDTRIPYHASNPRGDLKFNEYVIYDPSHLTIRYILHLKACEAVSSPNIGVRFLARRKSKVMGKSRVAGLVRHASDAR